MRIPKLTDIHSHILFGVDDGARDLEAALELAHHAAEVRISTILATPHATEMTNRKISNTFLDHFDGLKQALEKHRIPVQVFLGAELFYSERIYDWLQYPWATFNNNNRYLLFELPLFDLPDRVGDFVFQCRLKGLTPILAHPERYVYMYDKVDKLMQWSRQGCLMQANAGSFLGQFGQNVSEFALKMLRAGFFQFAASDAHDLKSRSYGVLADAYQFLSREISPEEADLLFSINPQKAIAGQSISQRPLNETAIVPPRKNWMHWIKRLRGKSGQ